MEIKNLLKLAAKDYCLAHECFILDYHGEEEYAVVLNLDKKEDPKTYTLTEFAKVNL